MNLNHLISAIGQAEGWGLEFEPSGSPRMAKYNKATSAPFGLLGDTKNKPSLKSDPHGLYRFMRYKLTDPKSATYVPGLVRTDGSVDDSKLSKLRDRWAPLNAKNDPKGLNNNWLSTVSNFLGRTLEAVIPTAQASEATPKKQDTSIRAHLHDGRVLVFPQGTQQEVIDATVKKELGVTSKPKYDPTEGMSGTETFFAGMGKKFVDTARGLGQMTRQGIEMWSPPEKNLSDLVTGRRGHSFADTLGLPTQEDIDESKRLDAPLMNTTGGKFGNIAGGVIEAVPTAFIPGANTVKGASLIGAAMGASDPVASDESRLTHTAIGAGGGAGGIVAGRVIPAVVKGTKALVEPFYESGRQQIVGRTVQRFASDPAAAARNAGRNRSYVSGSNPTLAEASGDAGLAQLQRGAQSVDPQIGAALAEREAANNAARISAIRGIAQNEPARDAAVAAREAATEPLYSAAKAMTVDADDPLRELLKRPSMQKAWTRAQTLAKEKGETIQLGQDVPAQQVASGVLDASGNPVMTTIPAQNAQYTGNGLHYLKMALDDLLDNPAQNGIGKNELRALSGTRAELGSWLETNLAPYGQARSTYAKLSKPINQMDTGDYLLDKMQPALADFGMVPRTRAEMYANALRNSEQTAKKTTGFAQPLEAIMTRGQMKTLTGVGKDLARRAQAQDFGRSVGSNTAQNLASQNILRQVMGPLGLPESWSEATLLREIMRPVQFAYKGAAEPKMQEALARALLDPKYAATLMKSVAPQDQQRLGQLLEQALPLLGRGGILPTYGSQ